MGVSTDLNLHVQCMSRMYTTGWITHAVNLDDVKSKANHKGANNWVKQVFMRIFMCKVVVTWA